MLASADLNINEIADQALPQLLHIPRRQRKRILRHFRPVRIDAHRQFIRHGTSGRDLFVIANGSATVVQNRNELATAEVGDFVGEMALLTGECRNADVMAQEDIVGVALNRREFALVCDVWPTFHGMAANAAFRHLT